MSPTPNDTPSIPPRKKAVALKYDAEQDAAPRVVAKGLGLQADRIVELAQEHGIHVHPDAGLAALLAQLDVNSPVPEELYQAVAQVLAFVYRMNQQFTP